MTPKLRTAFFVVHVLMRLSAGLRLRWRRPRRRRRRGHQARRRPRLPSPAPIPRRMPPAASLLAAAPTMWRPR